MREVLTRRFTHGLREREESKELGGFTAFPDLILMDGGKGQVNVAQQVLDELHLHIPVCGMVKDDHHRTRGLSRDEEITIDRSSEAFKLITRIQDEAHRFAIEYHKQLRGKGQVHSILDDIEGIGPARRKALMRSFQNLDEIKEASVEVLTAIPSMNEKAANPYTIFFIHDIMRIGQSQAGNTPEASSSSLENLPPGCSRFGERSDREEAGADIEGRSPDGGKLPRAFENR